ncbi:MAG: hypothetical protein AW12_00797 [Candidatus Accumulibacter sp. BA-94]|nr:MAG: hypothetical protein AW12_00797 [Candidatus Accumulibacter sp. BA-94]
MRTLAYTAARRSALSADTRIPLDARMVTGSNQKSPHSERSLEARQRLKKLKNPMDQESSRIGRWATNASFFAGLVVAHATVIA